MSKTTQNTEVALLATADEFELKVAQFEITTPQDMTRAVEFLSELNRANDKVVASRELLTKPLNTALKEIRDRYRPTETKLTAAISAMRSKISAWQTAAKKKADAEAAKITDRVGEGKGKLKPETAVAKMDAIDKPEATVSTESGQVKFKTDHDVVIDDASKVPPEYVKEYRIAEMKKAILSGKTIPGVHLEEKQVPINLR